MANYVSGLKKTVKMLGKINTTIIDIKEQLGIVGKQGQKFLSELIFYNHFGQNFPVYRSTTLASHRMQAS